MVAEIQALGPTWPDPTALVDLIDDLRAAGYNLDLTHYMAAQDLLLALAARGQVLDSEQRLQGLLGPLLCSSLAEQAEFPHHFAQWAAHLPRPAEPTLLPPMLTGDLEEELVAIDWQAKWGRRALISIYILFLLSLLQTSHPPIPRAAPIPTLVATIAVTPVEPIPAANNTPVIPTPEQRQPVPTLFEQLVWQTLPVVLLLLTLWLAWQLWWFYRAHLFLVRHATTQTPELEKVVVHSNATTLFNPLRLFRLAQELRRRVEIPAHELDIEAALSATIQRAGWFTPIYGRRRVVPEYLILIDRTHYHDHQARLVEELVQRLRAHEVLITSYAFDGDPRLCFPLVGKGAPLTLRDLAAKHPGQRLLLFADVHRLFSPFTGELEPWVAHLARWPERALLTPEVATSRGYREQELAQYFSVLPATPDGLAQLVHSLTQPALFTATDGLPQAHLPEALRTRPLRWLERQPPEPEQVETLLTALRTYLDETAFTWLCACAVYPAIDWNLTLYLGQALQTEEGASYLDPNRLLSLARLPWLRYGYMPDWLRSQLLNSLSRPQEKAVRFALQTLLVTAVQGMPVGFPLEIARRHQRSLSRLARPLLSLLVRRADKNSPLQDYVFLNFMVGNKHRSLAIHLPEHLFALFSRQQASFVKLSATFKRVSQLSRNWTRLLVKNSSIRGLNPSLIRYAIILILLNGLVYVTLRILAPSLNLFLFILIFDSLFLAIAIPYILLNRRDHRLVSKAVETTHHRDLSLFAGRYQISQRLGFGWEEGIYLAEDRNLARKLVVVKQCTKTTLDTRRQFLSEANSLVHLRHPALPRITDHFIEPDDDQFLVMEYIEGKNLWELLQENGGPLPEATVLGWMSTVMHALDYLHNHIDPTTRQAQPIIHRDVKPTNIKLNTKGQIYLVDLGLSKIAEKGKDTQNLALAKAATPGYSPIEQYVGRTSVCSDIYALGATLYALLTGKLPPESLDLLSDAASLASPRQLNPKISRHTEQAILRAMALQPQERFQTIAEMRKMLFRTPIQTSSSTQKAVPEYTWRSILIAPAIIVTAVVFLFSAFYITDRIFERDFIGQIANLFRQTPTALPVSPTLTVSSPPVIVAVAPSLTPTVGGITNEDLAATATADEQRLVKALAERDATATAEIKRLTVALAAILTAAPTATPDLTATENALNQKLATALAATLTAQPSPPPTATPTPDSAATQTAQADRMATSVAATLVARPAPTPTLFVSAVGQTHGGALRIAFAHGDIGDTDLWVADVETGAVHTIASQACDEAEPAWSSNNAQIVYHADCAESYDIYRVNSDSTASTRLTFTPNLDEREPEYSPDGSQIIYRVNQREVTETNAVGELWVMDATGNNSRALGVIGRAPAWSPDGRQIAFMSDRTGRWNLYLYEVATSRTSQLTNCATNCRWPAWSPDGKSVVFNTTTKSTNTEAEAIWIIPSTGGTAIQIATERNPGRPSWSSTGLIAFNSADGIEYMREDGSERTLLIADKLNWAPQWSKPGGLAPFVLFSGDPRSSSSLCRGFQSQCNFAGCDAFVKLIEGPGCVEGDDDRIVPGLYEVTLEGSGLVLAGRMTNTDPLVPVPADGYNVTLSGSYPICWPGWRSDAEPFGILAVTQTQLPNRVDHVEIRYVGATCP